ncbi:ribonuclease HI family protein [Sphingomonas sp. LaA6.9]|uniref:ribonuclease HI family protein n=1 Tax=Sphingomonas sp. LaA6.9 TaxID=2919914 RepID=UPI001F4F6401|nr:ribonuclease HI family protein [Sphingomonas sp. LaA6.9]MCJ8156760.1 ribonuclease HI family protein [Sphingomonas sp. LaA6.9]
MPKGRLKLFFDGGCRPNPGTMELAVVARGVVYHQPDMGHGTNNDAEWLALIHALEIAHSLGATEIELVGDSALVVNQAAGLWKCRGADLREHHDTFTSLADRFSRIRIRHVKRSQNLAGIALSKRRDGL